ncbi:MAG: type II toxin-antitoxin system HicB family antitoxin [Alcanivorax sp.]|nr:type II toxin-antitoxin system HicB family antitoxin [Alcanivorax sp.]
MKGLAVYYPALLERDGGGYVVTFPDLPEAITEGEDMESALFNAAEVLSLALEQRIDDGDPIPTPSKVRGAKLIEPDVSVQVAVLFRLERERQQKTLTEIARALETSWPAAQRLERPRGNPTLRQLERAAAALGKRLHFELV